MKKINFSKWCEMEHGRNWGEMRKEYLSEGFDKNTVDNVLKTGLEEDHEKYLKAGAENEG